MAPEPSRRRATRMMPGSSAIWLSRARAIHRVMRNLPTRTATLEMTLARARASGNLLLVVLVLVVIGSTTAACTSSAALPSATESSSPVVAQASSPAATTVATAMPVATAPAALDGVPVGFTEEGYPYQGAADAPVTLVEYTDYLCPFCARHTTQTAPVLVDKYVRTGQVKWVFRDLPIASLHPTSAQGHMAAQCIAQQGAALFWRMHDQLFTNQAQWSQLPDPSAYLAQVAQGLGADMAAYSNCVASGRSQAVVDKGIADAAALGFNGTPSFQFLSSKGGGPYALVGAQSVEVFSQWIDALLAGQAPPVPTPEPTRKAELPFWARPSGLAPDPARPGYTVAGDPYKGDPQAPLVVVEFSDFQCPSSRRHALEVQPTLDKQFVGTREILWVFKNLPLKEHVQAPAAAVAAECAGEQGKFWEMYNLLFQKVADWAVDQPDTALVALGGQLQLDVNEFSACLQGRTGMERVLADVYDAEGVATVTPTFVILYGGQGAIMRGTHPADKFAAILQGFLDEVKAGP